MKITIRMDDITPGMDWKKFERFKAILDKHGVKPLIGVVPDNRDKKLQIDPPRDNFWDYIKELQNDGWVVAMHGLTHVYSNREPGMFPIGDKSEFAGISYEKQDEMIREGRRILKSNGIMTDFFMAPSHSYDRNTLKALRKNGFARITDGFGKRPYEMDGLIFYPISVSRRDTLKSSKDGIVTFVFHANTMLDKDFDYLEKLFDRADIVSFEEYINMDTDVRGAKEEIAEYLTAKSKYMAVRLRRGIKNR